MIKMFVFVLALGLAYPFPSSVMPASPASAQSLARSVSAQQEMVTSTLEPTPVIAPVSASQDPVHLSSVDAGTGEAMSSPGAGSPPEHVLLRFQDSVGPAEDRNTHSQRDPQGPPFISDQIIISFQPGVTVSQIAKFYAEHGLVERDRLGFDPDGGPKLRLVDVKPSNQPRDLQDIIEDLMRDGRVVYAEPNYIFSLEVTPDDLQLGQLWGLNNTGQTGGTADADIDAPEAWNITTGSTGVIVGIIDTGVDYNHPDLAANMWVNPGEVPNNGIDDDGNGYIDDVYGINAITNTGNPMDDNGHGTHTAGTIGARGNNSQGVAGVNWNVRIAACKFLSSSGSGSSAAAVKCFKYFNYLKKVQGQNVVVTNNSWGGGGFSQALENAMAGLDQPGLPPILHAAAAGNSNNDNNFTSHYPSSYPLGNIVAVAATDHNDLYASFSSYGATSVDLGAPGVNILSTVPSGSCSLCDSSGYKSLNGTSMATPHVAGAAALVWSLYPGLSAVQVKQRLLWSGDSIGNIGSNAAKPTLSNSRLNVFSSLEDDTVVPDAVTDLSVSSTGLVSATLTWTATGDDGVTGDASAYDLRYATAPISLSAWDSATRVAQVPPPQPAGSAESFQVSGLHAETAYYFALKVLDNSGNASGLSNGATGMTLTGTAVFQDDMEGGPGGWTTTGLWNLDDYRSVSPSHAWYYGQPATRSYDTKDADGNSLSNSGTLTSAAIDLTGATDAIVTFSEWSKTEPDYRFDRTRIQASSDGTIWGTIFESHNTQDWFEETVSLSSYAGGNVYLQFWFTTRDNYYNNFEGWYIDDVRVLVGSAGPPPPDTTPPAAPSGLGATAGDGQVSLDWADNTESDLAGYDIYRDTNSGGPYSLVNASLVTASAYTDTGLVNGVTYYYVVTAMDTNGNQSANSSEVTATPHEPPDTTPPAAPTGLIATAGDGQVSLDWADNTESDLTGYDIYRATSTGSPYTRVNAALVTTSEYTDTGLAIGTTYYYVITAMDASSNVSVYSSEASATPAVPAAGVTVTGINPDTVQRGTSVAVTITGTGFAAGASVTFEGGSGPAPTALDVVLVNAGTITATVTAKSGGPPKPGQWNWNVRVTNPDGSSAFLNGLTVIP